MGTDNSSNPTSQEIPDNNSTVVATNSKQSAPFIECARNGHRDTIEGSIEFLSKTVQISKSHQTIKFSWLINIPLGNSGQMILDDKQKIFLYKFDDFI